MSKSYFDISNGYSRPMLPFINIHTLSSPVVKKTCYPYKNKKYEMLCRQKKCCSGSANGVLSIEAALIMPLFMILMMCLISVIGIMYINISLDCIVYEEAKNTAMLKHVDKAYGIDAIRVNIIDALGEPVIHSGFIKGEEAGLDFSDSDVTDNEIIKLSVKYDADIPYDIIDVMNMTFESKCVMHAYTGYVNGLTGYLDDCSEYVYIASDSEVYHLSRECSHIRLDIKSVKPADIADLRNNNGGKYKQCKACHADLNNAKLYITSNGDRYHASLSCSGLKRTITRVKITDVGDRRPCKRCGY